MQKFAYPSLRSLYIEIHRDGCPPACATGFVVNTRLGPHLITNRHVVTGADNITHHVNWIPTELRIFHHKKDCVGQWVQRSEPLIVDNADQWHEHPILKDKADFVALPLSNLDDVDLYCYSPENPWHADCLGDKNGDFLLGPSDVVSIVGFPFGKSTGGYFPLWVTGFLASEVAENYQALPIQLVDSRTRTGQSGSPVIAYRSGGAIATGTGCSTIFDGPVAKFIGVYSGRINKDSDIGMVWKADAIAELIRAI